jgi:predicted acetyltransferase
MLLTIEVKATFEPRKKLFERMGLQETQKKTQFVSEQMRLFQEALNESKVDRSRRQASSKKGSVQAVFTVPVSEINAFLGSITNRLETAYTRFLRDGFIVKGYNFDVRKAKKNS